MPHKKTRFPVPTCHSYIWAVRRQQGTLITRVHSGAVAYFTGNVAGVESRVKELLLFFHNIEKTNYMRFYLYLLINLSTIYLRSTIYIYIQSRAKKPEHFDPLSVRWGRGCPRQIFSDGKRHLCARSLQRERCQPNPSLLFTIVKSSFLGAKKFTLLQAKPEKMSLIISRD